MATVKRSEEFVTYVIETDSMGKFPNSSEAKLVSMVERTSDQVINTEVIYVESRENPNGYYEVHVSLKASDPTPQRRKALREVLVLLRKQELIVNIPEEDLKRL